MTRMNNSEPVVIKIGEQEFTAFVNDAHVDVDLAEVDRRTESLHRHRQLKAAMLERDPDLFVQEGESVSRSRGRHARVRIDRFQQTSVLIERLSDLNQQLFQSIQTLEKLVNLLLREFHDSSSPVDGSSTRHATGEGPSPSRTSKDDE